ncbi:MAG: HlyD family efflux transporter periplasmic adaptor subunit [Maricaulaceae bacterium]|jgi:HlyD family secretion protein
MIRALLPLTLLVALAGCSGSDDVLHGYAEGRFRTLAPDVAGRVVAIEVAEGQRVSAGAVVARLDDARETAELERAEAAAEAAEARFDDAAAGGRAPEIEAAREMLTQARAAADDAHDELERIEPLFTQGVVPRARLDAAEAAVRAADSRVAEMRERVTLAELPARENALRALGAEADAARAAVDAARDALAKRVVRAPSDGLIERILRDEGETAAPTAPVVRFLPDGDLVAILFAPEPRLGALSVGDPVSVQCDGCGDALAARISHIASEAEYTAPTIFSDKERARLVYRIEARFEDAAPPAGAPLRARLETPAS